MKRNSLLDGLWSHPRSLLAWTAVLTLGGGSLGMGFALQSRNEASVGQDSRHEASRLERGAAVVACLGIVDFDAGVLSLQPTVSGRVVDVPVIENQQIRTRAILLRLDDEAARARVGEAEAALQAASAQLAEAVKAPRQHQLLLDEQKAAVEAAEYDLDSARLTASRQSELADLKLINRKDADAAADQVKKLEAVRRAQRAKLEAVALRDPAQEVRRAEAEVRGKRQALDQARHFLGEHTLRAPSDGTVLRVSTRRGDVIGLQTREPALTFAPDQPRIVRAEVDQEFVDRVAKGQRAEIEDDASPAGARWTGRVVRIAEWFTQRRAVLPDTPAFQDVRMLECVIQLDAGQARLRIGQRVRVKLFNG